MALNFMWMICFRYQSYYKAGFAVIGDLEAILHVTELHYLNSIEMQVQKLVSSKLLENGTNVLHSLLDISLENIH